MNCWHIMGIMPSTIIPLIKEITMAMTPTWSLIGSTGSTTDFQLQGNTSTEATYVAPAVGSALKTTP